MQKYIFEGINDKSIWTLYPIKYGGPTIIVSPESSESVESLNGCKYNQKKSRLGSDFWGLESSASSKGLSTLQRIPRDESECKGMKNI